MMNVSYRRLLAGTLLFAACGSGSPSDPPPDNGPAELLVESGSSGSAVVSTRPQATPVFRVVDASGAGVSGVSVTLTPSTGSWVTQGTMTTDAAGRVMPVWYLGPDAGQTYTLGASTGSFTAQATATTTPAQPGQAYEGANAWVEYRAGDLPLIVTAPHGGQLTPTTIPARTGPNATTVRDANTDLLAADIEDAVLAATGGRPHVIIVHLHRSRLDANREIVEAAEGNAAAERTWREYHAFVEAAKRQVLADHGRGLYLDLHGHGHEIQRLELGYLLSSSTLAGSDALLNSTSVVQSSSIRNLAQTSSLSHAELLRGSTSFGTLFELEGYPAVPSSAQPDPGGAPYFTGGYNTERYGSRNGGTIDGIQIEANMQGVRDTQASRTAFAAALTRVVQAYFDAHYDGILAALVAH